jgi:hypothetical protein
MDYLVYFTTTAGLIALIDALTEFFKLKFKISTSIIQYVSWGIGILLAVVGQIFGLGMFETLTWIQTVIAGFGAALASNGVFDTGLVDWIVSLFKPKAKISE